MTPAKLVELTKQQLTESRKTERARTPDGRMYYDGSPDMSPPSLLGPRSPDMPPPATPYGPRSPDSSPPTDVPYGPRSPDMPPPSTPYGPRSPDSSPPMDVPYGPRSPDMPPPEAYGPRTPDSTPPPENAVSNKEFQRGETVFLRGGGSKADRQWFVKDTGGGEYITIETHDLEGLNDIQDSIKVVSPCDLFRPSDIVYDNNYPIQRESYSYNEMPNGMGMGMNAMGMGTNPMNNGMPNIEVNPVIKIVNGPDNSIDTSVEGKSQQSINDTDRKGSFGQEMNSMLPPAENIPGMNEAPLDFSKLVIKKV